MLKILVNIVPICPVFFQKGFKFRLILDYQLGKARGGEGGCHILDGAGVGVDGIFKPCHGFFLLCHADIFYIVPHKRENNNRESLKFLCPTIYLAKSSI